MPDTLESLRIRIGELELALEAAEERDSSYYDLQVATKALVKANEYAASLERRLEALTGEPCLIADLVEAQRDGTVDDWRKMEDAKRAARAGKDGGE